MNTNQIWQQNSQGIKGKIEERDLFGSSLITGDFDGNGIQDLAISASGESIDNIKNAGVVHLLYSSNNGLTAKNNQAWHQNSQGIKDKAENFDSFGSSLAKGDFNGDGIDDLAIGSIGETIDNVQGAGAVNVIYGSSSGLTAKNNQIWHQNSPEIKGKVENLDEFSSSLAAGDFNGDGIDDLAIGSHAESIGDIIVSGAVNVIYGSSSGLTANNNQAWHQNSPGIKEQSEQFDFMARVLTADDFNGDGIDDLAIAAPFDSVDNIESTGAVNVIYGSLSGLTAKNNQVWHQNSQGIQGKAKDSDEFGSSLTTGDFNGDNIADLAVGIAGKDISGMEDAGAVNIIYGSSSGLIAKNNQIWHQNSQGIKDRAEQFDGFGSSLATGDFNGDGIDDLAIGSHAETIDGVQNAGAVNIIYGSSLGLTAADNQVWHQNSQGIKDQAEQFDGFGFSLSAGDFNSDGIDDLAIGSVGESIDNVQLAGATYILYGSESGLTAF